jgi:hypothetical protein
MKQIDLNLSRPLSCDLVSFPGFQVRVIFEDGAQWYAAAVPGQGVRVRIAKLGELHEKSGPLLPAIASAFEPDVVKDLPDEAKIPDVDCGNDYRQLLWGECIASGDEYYDAESGQWELVKSVGEQYHPMHAYPMGRNHPLIRRKYP